MVFRTQESREFFFESSSTRALALFWSVTENYRLVGIPCDATFLPFAKVVEEEMLKVLCAILNSRQEVSHRFEATSVASECCRMLVCYLVEVESGDVGDDELDTGVHTCTSDELAAPRMSVECLVPRL